MEPQHIRALQPDDGRQPLPAASRTVLGPRPHYLLALQRSAGNRAVAAWATRTARRPPVQRQPPAPPATDAGAGTTFTVPAALLGTERDLVVADGAGAKTALLTVAAGLGDRAASLDTVGEAALRRMAEPTRAEAGKLTTAGPLSAGDAAYLNGFVSITASSQDQAIQQAL
jgi:hypothetical protein